MSRSM